MKSKKPSRSTRGKWLLEEPPVFFLDRTFGKTVLASSLRAAGFIVVTHYEEYGDEGHKIADPVIIADCGFKNRILLTGDKDLQRSFAPEIVDAKIAVFITTENHEGPANGGLESSLPKQTFGRNWLAGTNPSQRTYPVKAEYPKSGCTMAVHGKRSTSERKIQRTETSKRKTVTLAPLDYEQAVSAFLHVKPEPMKKPKAKRRAK